MSSLTDLLVHPLSEPRPYPISYLRDNQLFPVLINGIVNPNGPTLTVVAAVRDQTSAPLALVYAYLNPFKSELFIPGYLIEGQLVEPITEQILRALESFNLFKNGAPSLCIPDGYLDAFDIRYLYGRLFANCNEIHSHYERLKRFPLNPWDRVSEEVQEAMSSITGEQDIQIDNTDKPMRDEEMEALLDIVLDPEHNKKELQAFGYAWKGSIDQQRKSNNNALADKALQYDDFVELLSHILESSGYDPD